MYTRAGGAERQGWRVALARGCVAWCLTIGCGVPCAPGDCLVALQAAAAGQAAVKVLLHGPFQLLEYVHAVRLLSFCQGVRAGNTDTRCGWRTRPAGGVDWALSDHI